jgi:PAS domain S-box-containing protein
MDNLGNYSDMLTIFIIEDNQGDYILIEDYLIEKFKQIKLIHSINFSSAVNLLQKTENDISIILLDLNLPDLDGIDLVKKILQYNRGVPVIILTGYSDLIMARKSLEIGVVDFLIKDEINPTILYKTINFALNRNSFIRQLEYEKYKYEELFNFNPQPTFLLESESLEILNVNLATQKKYGIQIDNLIGMSFTQLHPKEEQNLINDKFKRNGFHSISRYFTHILGDGKEIKVEIHFQEVDNDIKRRFIVQPHDISETLKHIHTIEMQNEKLRNIAWTQSHLVRAPLSRILGIINLLEMQDESIDEVFFWLKQLRVSTEELDEIVKKITNETNQLDRN